MSIFASKNTEDSRTVRQMGTKEVRRVAAPGKSKQKYDSLDTISATKSSHSPVQSSPQFTHGLALSFSLAIYHPARGYSLSHFIVCYYSLFIPPEDTKSRKRRGASKGRSNQVPGSSWFVGPSHRATAACNLWTREPGYLNLGARKEQKVPPKATKRTG